MNNEDVLDYKLYRSLPEIFHPSISKKNISIYKIVFDDKLLPVRIHYPEKITKIKNIVIFVPGNDWFVNHSGSCNMFSDELESIVISIDYNGEKIGKGINKKVHKLLEYILDNLKELNLGLDTVLCGEGYGSTMLVDIGKSIQEKYNYKQILFYPGELDNTKFVLKKYNDIKVDTLLVVGTADSNYDNIKKAYDIIKENTTNSNLVELEFLAHNFLLDFPKEEKKGLINSLAKFMNK